MPNSNSLEQNIYRNLAAQIQSGFYSKGNRFPPAQEIARLFNVSYGPAQRALKALEKEGLIKVGRGKETLVLKKPYENYLESDTFKKRILSLIDLSHSLAAVFTCHQPTGNVPYGSGEGTGKSSS